MEKHVLSHQTGFLSGQNLSLAGQMTCLPTKIICRLELCTSTYRDNVVGYCRSCVVTEPWKLLGVNYTNCKLHMYLTDQHLHVHCDLNNNSKHFLYNLACRPELSVAKQYLSLASFPAILLLLMFSIFQ